MTEKNDGRARTRGAARETTNCNHSSSAPHALASYLNLSPETLSRLKRRGKI